MSNGTRFALGLLATILLFVIAVLAIIFLVPALVVGYYASIVIIAILVLLFVFAGAVSGVWYLSRKEPEEYKEAEKFDYSIDQAKDADIKNKNEH